MDYYNVPTTIFTPIEYDAISYSGEDVLSKFGEDNIMSYCKSIVDKNTVN
jgi:thioredoxin reductase (NADPH)